MSVFDEVKNRVTVLDAARRCGFEPNRAGYICCPFHAEKTASCKLYPDGFHCFGCGAGGSVIDFTARLFGTDPLSAVRLLDREFGLGLALDRAPTPAELEAVRRRRRAVEVRRSFELWREQLQDQLTDVLKAAHFAELELKTPEDLANLREAEIHAIQWKAAAEYFFRILSQGSAADQMAVFRDRLQVERKCKTILNSLSDTLMKSRTA